MGSCAKNAGGESLTNSRPSSSNMRWPVALELRNYDPDNHHAAAHECRSSEEHGLAAELVNYQLQLSVPSTPRRHSLRVRLTIPGTVLMIKITPVTPVARRATVPLVNPRLMNTLEA